MTTITNTPEKFFREVRFVEIYPAHSLTFKQNMAGEFPPPEDLMHRIRVIPEDYDRSLATKKRSGNHFISIDLNFPLLDMSTALRAELYEKWNRTGFCVVLHSNTEKTALGNHLEPLTVEFLDGIKDDASGTDQFNISITGETIVTPKSLNI